MLRRILLGLVTLTLAVVVAGCVGSDVVSLTIEDSGTEVALAVGNTLELVLESNPTTGYSWEVDEIDEDVLAQEGEVTFEKDSDLMGAPGMETFTFRAEAAGETELTLVYHRPWEDEPPLDTYSITVRVE